MDRTTGKTLGYALRPPSGIYKLVLDVRFTADPLLLVGILDNDLQYNAAVADGVKLQLVDGNTVNLSQ
ncbi:hypothetical protein MSG37_03395 [Shewanella sp. 1CM18E]|uniref:hypothetical protein n=1 Tax=Shewanella sp. 1CM18E TaxID=2929169 RepID=UPI0020C1529D|nr:hypothetical protein [Shewanella sp. 1CM18E]MCK8043917.1 hypothetical protein [Shewanella sp. 1CM18E]